MQKFVKTVGIASFFMTGSAVMMTPALADYSRSQGNAQSNYQGNHQGNGYAHQRYTPTKPTTTSTATTVTNSGSQYNYRNQNANRYSNANNGNHYGQYNNGNRYNTYNNASHYGQYQNRYGTQPQVINGRPQYNYRTAYPARPAYPAYDRARDYRYGYTSRPQWYGRMHPNEYNVLRRDGRDYYYLQPNIYSTGVVIGRPQPGVVLMQYPDRTLEIIEATRLILDVMYRR